MKKFKLLPILLLLCMTVSLFSGSALALDTPEIGASAACLMNANTGEIYYGKNENDRVYPASTTKMVTALLVVEAIERGDISLYDTVGAYDDCQYNMDYDSSNANPIISPGEEMTVEDLLYCAMLVSANEACNILAEYVSGSIDSFVTRMNEKAAECGCTGTHFTNTNGLEDSGHYTTAADFALIARQALTHSLFKEIVGTRSYTVPATNVNYSRSLENTNQLLDPDGENYYPTAYGVKTGYFSNAGYCLVSAARVLDSLDVVCVVMGAGYDEATDTYGHYADTLTIYDWFTSNYSFQTLLGSAAELTSIPVYMGAEDSVSVRAETAVSALLPNDFDSSAVEYQIILYNERDGERLEAPVSAGDRLGEVTVVMDGESYGFSYLVANGSVDMSRLQYLRSAVRALFQKPVIKTLVRLLIVLLALYLVLVIIYRVQRIRHNISLRQAKRKRSAARARQEASQLRLPQERDEPEVSFFPEEPSDDAEPDTDDGSYDDFFRK